MPAGGLIVSGALGLGEAAMGLINAGKANKQAAELERSRPKLTDSPYLKDQLHLAESDLSTGMSAGAKYAYESDMDRSLSSSLGAITRLGGSPNNVGDIFSADANGRARLAIMKDNLRLQQITNLTRAQDASEEERQKQFEFNEWMPWADKAQANAKARESAENEIFSGINTAGAGAMRFGQQQTSASQFSSYLKTAMGGGGKTTPPPATTPTPPTLSPSTLQSLLSESGATQYLF